LDTGIDPEHPDFGNRIVAAANCLKSPGAGQPDPRDEYDRSALDGNGHGTHVAGIAAGNGAASDGRYRGVAPEASLLVAKVLDDSGAGEASDVIAGLEWAFDKGAQVACLSLGGDEAGDGTDALSTACDEFVERGLLICVAAGNAGPQPYTVGPPGCARQVIAVGAADLGRSGTGIVTVAGFSSRGPTSDKRTKPDILFPGVGIASCRALQGHMGDPVGGHAEHYVRASGTSMAAPFAAGTCALLLQRNPENTPNQVRDMLCAGARTLSEDANAQGSGLGDVAQSLLLLRESPEQEQPRPSGCLTAFLPWRRSQSRPAADPAVQSRSGEMVEPAPPPKEKR
jgi:serine protease AprX